MNTDTLTFEDLVAGKAALDREHCLYRLFSGERLLYVGRTSRPRDRFREHAATKPWFVEVDKITLESHRAADLIAAEAAAIARELPFYNQQLQVAGRLVADFGKLSFDELGQLHLKLIREQCWRASDLRDVTHLCLSNANNHWLSQQVAGVVALADRAAFTLEAHERCVAAYIFDVDAPTLLDACRTEGWALADVVTGLANPHQRFADLVEAIRAKEVQP